MSKTSRRDLVLSIPALTLLTSLAAAQQETGTAPDANFKGKSQNGLATDLTHCKAFPMESQPLRYSDAGAPTHDILRGTFPTGEIVEAHQTTIAPGKMPHPAHQHPHEELILVREGTIDFTYQGQSHTLTPGGVGYTAPNEMHGFRNSGTVPATYFIVSLAKR